MNNGKIDMTRLIGAQMRAASAVVALTFVVAGCGGDSTAIDAPGGPVSGTAKVGGTALPAGYVVLFESTDGRFTASGVIGEGGSYTLANHRGGDQIAAGEYKVYFGTPEEDAPQEAPDPMDTAAITAEPEESGDSTIPDKYLSADTSDLTVTVKEGEDNTLDLDAGTAG